MEYCRRNDLVLDPSALRTSLLDCDMDEDIVRSHGSGVCLVSILLCNVSFLYPSPITD